MESATCMTSFMLCDTRITAPPCSASRRTRSRTCSVWATPSAAVGSSRMTTFDFQSTDLAIATVWRWPPEARPGSVPRHGVCGRSRTGRPAPVSSGWALAACGSWRRDDLAPGLPGQPPDSRCRPSAARRSAAAAPRCPPRGPGVCRIPAVTNRGSERGGRARAAAKTDSAVTGSGVPPAAELPSASGTTRGQCRRFAGEEAEPRNRVRLDAQGAVDLRRSSPMLAISPIRRLGFVGFLRSPTVAPNVAAACGGHRSEASGQGWPGASECWRGSG